MVSRKARILQDMKLRYESYFKQKHENEEWEIQRTRARQEQRKIRLMDQREFDVARRQYAEAQKLKKEEEQDDSGYLRAEEEYRLDREKKNKKYKEFQALVNKIKAKGQEIPALEELGITDY